MSLRIHPWSHGALAACLSGSNILAQHNITLFAVITNRIEISSWRTCMGKCNRKFRCTKHRALNHPLIHRKRLKSSLASLTVYSFYNIKCCTVIIFHLDRQFFHLHIRTIIHLCQATYSGHHCACRKCFRSDISDRGRNLYLFNSGSVKCYPVNLFQRWWECHWCQFSTI